MSVCYLIQGGNLGNVEPLPSRLKRLIKGASGIDLCFSRNVITSDKEDSGVHKHKFPERNFRLRRIGGVSRDGTTLCQNRQIGVDVCGKRNLDYVMDSVGSQCPDSFHQVPAGQHNLVRSCSRCDFLITFSAATSNDSRSCLMGELYGTSSNCASTALD